MNTEENEPEFNTEQQRRALDEMSADLVRKLDAMIAEQEERVLEFAQQQPNNAPATYPAPEPLQQKQPEPAPAHTPLRAPTRHSVTPPPVKRAIPAPTITRTPPPVKLRPDKIAGKQAKADEKENSLGCGTLGIIVLVITLLIRACS